MTPFKTIPSRPVLALALLAALSAPALADVTLYEHEGFNGRSFSAERSVDNLATRGFNDRASSVVVTQQRWQVCDDAGFGGRCVVLEPGRYPSLKAMGLNDRVSSLRIDDWRLRQQERDQAAAQLKESERQREADRVAAAAAMTPPDYYRRRGGERIYQAKVNSVHAVVEAGERRCWTEREQVDGRGNANVPGAVLGAVIGGVLGHQIGGGTGRDIATAGGVVAGAAVGAQVGRDEPRSRDVQRCVEAPRNQRAEYWDVSYEFRGIQHRVQMTSAPGATINVNAQGEPRV
jgi:uncharacterized protein YcfJ